MAITKIQCGKVFVQCPEEEVQLAFEILTGLRDVIRL